jgi:hypothetical protein
MSDDCSYTVVANDGNASLPPAFPVGSAGIAFQRTGTVLSAERLSHRHASVRWGHLLELLSFVAWRLKEGPYSSTDNTHNDECASKKYGDATEHDTLVEIGSHPCSYKYNCHIHNCVSCLPPPIFIVTL